MQRTNITKNIDIELLETNTGQLPGLPPNPRIIRDGKFKALKNSIEESPEMLALRELLVYPLDNGHYVVIGGNMRLEACRTIGYAEVPCKIIDKDVPVEKLREYTIKDNGKAGEDDFDVITKEWDLEEFIGWNINDIEIPEIFEDQPKKGTLGNKNKSKGEPLCDLSTKPAMHVRNNYIVFANYKTSNSGIPLSEIKAGDEYVHQFANTSCEMLNMIFGPHNHKKIAIITTPKRRHKIGNFAEKVAFEIAKQAGYIFYQDAVISVNRDRLHPSFKRNANIAEDTIIIYDDILTTGSTINATTELFPEKNRIHIISIYNHS